VGKRKGKTFPIPHPGNGSKTSRQVLANFVQAGLELKILLPSSPE
jgi:hypothetical protein